MFAKLRRLFWKLAPPALAMMGAVFAAAPAHAQQRYAADPGYLGYSFLNVPDVAGDWRGSHHRGWVRADGHYWPEQAETSNASALRIQSTAPVPGAPRSGQGALVLSIRKESPALAALMRICASGAALPELGYAVSTDRSNRTGLRVPRPTEMPEYFEFTLINARFADCPVVEAAPEQAIVVRFSDIRWLNWTNEARSLPVALEPAPLTPLPRNLSGESRAWVMTWFALAHDVADDQCPVMNEKPTEDDYYALVPPEEAARERAERASQGGVSYETGQMGRRGPNRLDAGLLPGIVPDPGQAEPQTTTARGLNLDGARSGRHRNYVSQDGLLTGIDNQLYTVMGCNAGWQGHRGFLFQYMMEGMRNGQLSILLQVDGIDDARNDREVYVTMLYSTDDMAKNSSGSEILHDYTFRPTTDVQFTHYINRVRGRIVDGVITTDPADSFAFNIGRLGGPMPPGVNLSGARMRLEIQPDRTIRGVLAGYVDWRQIPTMNSTSIGEFSFGYQQPALYNSLRRNADGLRNPVTGEYDGISAAYDVEGVPAFIASPTPNIASATNAAGGGS